MALFSLIAVFFRRNSVSPVSGRGHDVLIGGVVISCTANSEAAKAISQIEASLDRTRSSINGLCRACFCFGCGVVFDDSIILGSNVCDCVG